MSPVDLNIEGDLTIIVILYLIFFRIFGLIVPNKVSYKYYNEVLYIAVQPLSPEKIGKTERSNHD